MATQENNMVGIWIRVSTQDQAKGESPEHHEMRARGYAKAKDWKVVELYDLSGVSGKSVLEHPETKRMLEDVRSGHISGLIFSKLARLARNTRELLDIADIFREHGAGLISLQEAIDTTTPAGRLFYTMIAAMAQWEREEISERVAASVPIRASLGKPTGGAAPFGFTWEKSELVINPDEAPIRKLMFELFLEHRRKKTVARLLNEMGHRTRKGAKFSDTTVDRLLRDPVAKGLRRANYTKSRGEKKHWDLKPEDEWVYTKVDPIVTEELWGEVNAILTAQRSSRQRVGRKPAVHLFSSVTRCECGQPMYVPSNSPKYTCRKCRNKIPVSDLEAIYRDQLRSFLLSKEDLNSYLNQATTVISEKTDQLDILEKEKRELLVEMDRYCDLYLKDNISQEGFKRKHSPLETRLAQINEELPSLQSEIDFLKIQNLSSEQAFSETQALSERWDTLDKNEQLGIIEAITDSIVIGKEEVSINLHYLPFLKTDNLATHEHGFIAAMSWNRASYSTTPLARAIWTQPVSIGSRNTSSERRLNSGNSSRNSTPLCAREISPGASCGPPPTSAAAVAVWCGERNGRTPQLADATGRPSTDSIAAVASDSASLIGGMMPGRRRASILLPVPGGPTNNRLCPPAAAISSARFACRCPLTSRKSISVGGCTAGLWQADGEIVCLPPR